MKFKAFEENPQEEPTVYFRVIADEDGEPVLVACDKKGTRLSGGNIARITFDGRLSRYKPVSSDLGLKLDDMGRIDIR